MIYAFEIITPANTPRNDPLITELKLTKGVIHRIEIEFPYGPMNLLHLQIFEGGHQLYPLNLGDSFVGNDTTIAFNDYYELKDAPYALYAHTWNEDTLWEHRVLIRIGILEKEIANPLEPVRVFVNALKRLMGI